MKHLISAVCVHGRLQRGGRYQCKDLGDRDTCTLQTAPLSPLAHDKCIRIHGGGCLSPPGAAVGGELEEGTMPVCSPPPGLSVPEASLPHYYPYPLVTLNGSLGIPTT